ncbi:hypothetical protein [Streptomyces sp. 3213.3]|uniref:hypothetical protein n=1 Tax=Streptomyces sp. 3213.3 TaxID=1855348 RepID=UPI00190E92F9|nr:hypothetical protein [Streptomyces sp. 3213.3]
MTALTRNAGTAGDDDARLPAVDHSSTVDLADAYRGAEGVFVHWPVASEEDLIVFAQ